MNFKVVFSLLLATATQVNADSNVFVEPCQRASLAAKACCENASCDSQDLLNQTKKTKDAQAAAQAAIGNQSLQSGAATQQALLQQQADLENKISNACSARVETCYKQCRSAVNAGDANSQVYIGSCNTYNKLGQQLNSQANSDYDKANGSGETSSSSSSQDAI